VLWKKHEAKEIKQPDVVNVHVHFPAGYTILDEILRRVKNLEQTGARIMGALEDAQAAISKIDAATTNQATRLSELASALQETSDDIDKLIADAGVPVSLATDLQAKADALQAVSDALDQHVAFSKAIASKSPANPVPVPVPDPIP
jgi:methyl-accepting chemotaxis protein